jgi:DNA polymerase-3 subunit epsilon
MPIAQRSFEDLGIPLAAVEFCVVDLETTGGSPASAEITEIGAIKVRCGETLGTFHTLVDPGQPVPAFIRLLTGITDEMLVEAPPIEAVLPSFLEFARDSVVVAHNARFDVSFLNAALSRNGYPSLTNRVVDTARLARKILSGEVRNCRLETLARHLRCHHLPCHRAFADVLTTVDVLHHLIERVTGFGVTTLDDLLSITASRIDGTFSKISLCESLPSASGIYRFVGGAGQTLYVGKATDLRTRVRSYFYGDPRRKVRDLLRQTDSISFERYETMLEAEVAEARAIAAELPPHNSAGKRGGTWHVKIAPQSKPPKVGLARIVKDDDAVYLGPFSIRVARVLLDALRDALPIHRCSRPESCHGCSAQEMGTCPGARNGLHLAHVTTAAKSAVEHPDVILGPLVARMNSLADQERFEEAADVRDRGALLEQTLFRHAQVDALVRAGRVVMQIGSRQIVVDRGVLQTDSKKPTVSHRDASVIAAWLRRRGDEARLISVDGCWAMPASLRPGSRFKPRQELDAAISDSREPRAAPESIDSAARMIPSGIP